MTIFANKGETAWSQYHKLLLDILGGVQKPVVIQPLAISQRVEWDSQSAEYNLFLKQDIANTIPNWTPLYTRAVGRTVPDEYKAFLDRLNSKIIEGSGIADKKKLERLDQERREIRDKLDALDKEANARWRDYVRNTPPAALRTRAKWEEDLGISGTRENYQRQLQAAEGAYLVEVNNAGGDLLEIGRAISALGNSTQQMALPSSEELIPLGKDYWEYFYRTLVDGNITQFKSETAPVSFTVKEGQSQTQNFSSSWNAGVSLGWSMFFSANGSIEHEEKSRQWEEETTEIGIAYKNLKPFNIIRGAWFKGGLINRFVAKLDPSFWGFAGRLNLIPTQLVLAHGLSVDIKTSQEIGQYIFERHSVSGGGGFSIGPFRFGGRGGSTTSYENTKVERTNTGLHIEDTSGRAVVLAVLSQRPADFLEVAPTPLFVDLKERDRKRAYDLLQDARGEAQEAEIEHRL